MSDQSSAQVTAFTRSAPQSSQPPAFPTLGLLHAEPHLIHHSLSTAFATATHIVSTVPPTEHGDPVLTLIAPYLADAAHLSTLVCQLHILQSPPLLYMFPPLQLTRFIQIYLSSTSVYGTTPSPNVVESTPCHPRSLKASRHLSAENDWRTMASNHSLHPIILRLSGVYGPSRSAVHTLLENPHLRHTTLPTDQIVISRIYVHDVIRAILALLVTTLPSHITTLNVSDDCPASRADVFHFAATLLDQYSPDWTMKRTENTIQTTITSTSTKKSRPSLNGGTARAQMRIARYVSNANLKKYLLSTLQFPSYKTGLLIVAQSMFTSSDH